MKLKDNRLIKAASRIFGLRREERLFAAVMLLMLVAMNSLVIIKYFDRFTPLTKYYWQLFIRNFQISGFDPITYSMVTYWEANYNVYRHPLLSFMVWPLSQLNQWLMSATGMNLVQFIVAVPLLLCAVSYLILALALLAVYGVYRLVQKRRAGNAATNSKA